MVRTSLIAGLLLTTLSAHGHHGTAGQFDQSQSLQVAGTVTKIRFVNPHSYVYFDVVGDDGEVKNWRCEMRAATLLKRSGWTADMFAPGTKIKIDGVPARREPTGCYVNTIAFDDGEVVERYQQLDAADKGDVERELRRADGKPNFAGTWAAPQRLLTEATVRARAGVGQGNSAAAGGPPRGRGPSYEQTAAGKAASAGYEREDNPRFHCEATNIFIDWTFDQHINEITQGDDEIFLNYGLMDIDRTIYLNKTSHPADLTPTRAGHSIGHWDGDVLVVETQGFAEGYIDTRAGVKHSDALQVTERFSLSEDGKTLNRSWVGKDSKYLVGEFKGQDSIIASEAAFDPYNCEDLTEEIVDGF